MRKLHYPALIDKDADSDFGVSFPDFPGCVSAGESVEEAVIGAQEALAGHVALMLADGDAMPAPSALKEVAAQKEASTVAVTLIPVVLPGRARRVNVTLDEALCSKKSTKSATTAPASSPKPPAWNSPAAGLEGNYSFRAP